MTIDELRRLLAAHLIQRARHDIPITKIKDYLDLFCVPRDTHHTELTAIAELITDAQITITWEANRCGPDSPLWTPAQTEPSSTDAPSRS